MCHIDRHNVCVELFWSKEAQRHRYITKTLSLFVSGFGHDSGFIVPDVAIERGYEHQILFEIFIDLFLSWLDPYGAVSGE